MHLKRAIETLSHSVGRLVMRDIKSFRLNFGCKGCRQAASEQGKRPRKEERMRIEPEESFQMRVKGRSRRRQKDNQDHVNIMSLFMLTALKKWAHSCNTGQHRASRKPSFKKKVPIHFVCVRDREGRVRERDSH